MMSAAKRHRSPRKDITVSSSRSRLPSDGSGSATPSPSRLRLASARTNTGTDIQNWTSKMGCRFGSTCLPSSLQGETPMERDMTLKSDCRCLLYTSDAADEEDSVDLGGR